MSIFSAIENGEFGGQEPVNSGVTLIESPKEELPTSVSATLALTLRNLAASLTSNSGREFSAPKHPNLDGETPSP